MSTIIRNAYTAVVARGDWWEGELQTEPYEAAWAAEAVFFVHVMAIRGAGGVALARVQISPDGLHWVNEGGEMRIPAHDEALVFARVTQFGGWLRLAVSVPDQLGLQVVATLALKA